MDGLTVFEIACLCGGAERVAMTALVALHQDDRIKIGFARHRVVAVAETADDPIERDALAAIPSTGLLLRPALAAIKNTEQVRQVTEALRAKGLDGRIRAHRMRRELAADPGTGLHRIAVLGVPGIEDDRLRRVFEEPDPKPEKFKRSRHRGPDQPSNLSDTTYAGGGDGGF
ncbi:TIGR04222 domain-containing membrane protein [Actinomadura syzygii]|uniref:TIGR04222 domain-containing membrane protein n=1 Tax=Actinomadura syzygii TaxID=1427538 RepID=A0A5D0UEK4_9ACTN|nr:TIGR04222 domain-containing membrane protein [Actinomadura syzygii]TYC16045.1 TIGR04222 domain-containing membrane protein [Actinomadura syzygii]